MNILLIIGISFLVIITSILVWINLPGTFIFLFCAFFLGLYDNFEILDRNLFLIIFAIYIFLEFVEFLLSFIAIKKVYSLNLVTLRSERVAIFFGISNVSISRTSDNCKINCQPDLLLIISELLILSIFNMFN